MYVLTSGADSGELQEGEVRDRSVQYHCTQQVSITVIILRSLLFYQGVLQNSSQVAALKQNLCAYSIYYTVKRNVNNVL